MRHSHFQHWNYSAKELAPILDSRFSKFPAVFEQFMWFSMVAIFDNALHKPSIPTTSAA